MRLKKIKLAGFKSFVDPTVLELRSPLMAVVGPNGCGKSNIIDAIRWVMGESSAKNLRGETMADVIFNGSSSRKPVGKAAIEMDFDNSDGSLGGEYARFSEISVRREATRDGQSSYFLNGTRCRRKDITDIFLGTGLGPRSYSIIEQGMISRVIEARPEELRAFVEEAAGISLYRKRRHETEIRMRHTRENLERLGDLRQELDKQLERLKRQSESAERYKQYKEEHDKYEVELCALRWQVLNEQLQERVNGIRLLSNGLEEKLAFRASLDLDLEKLRIVHTEKLDAWKIDQGQYYDLGTQIARVEQNLQHHREREQNLENDLVQTEQNYQRTFSDIKEDEANLRGIVEEHLLLQPEYENVVHIAKQSENLRSDADETLRRWMLGFESFQQDAEKPQRTAEVEKARIEQLERQSREAKMQYDRLQKELSSIDIANQEKQLLISEQELLERESEGSSALTEVNALSLALGEQREILVNESKKLDVLRSRQQSLKGRLASLEALQQAALGKTNEVVKAWLNTQGLSDYPRLGEVIEVEKGFERAVETVLGDALEAICVPGVDAIASMIGGLEGNLAFIDSTLIDNQPTISFELLSSKLKTNLKIRTLLNGVYVVDELSLALQRQKTLEEGESIVTKEGVWFGPNWLRVYRGKEGRTGLLAREAEIKELNQMITALVEQIEASQDAAAGSQEKISILESKRESFHQSQQSYANSLKELSSKVSSLRAHLENVRNRMARLRTEAIDYKHKLDLAEEETALARINLQTALDAMEHYSKQRGILHAERDKLRDLFQKTSADASIAKEKAHALALKQQTLTTQGKAIEDGLNRLTKLQQIVEERRANLQAQLQGLKDPELEMRDTLETLLSKRLMSEDQLNHSRTALDEIEQELRSIEKGRHALEEETQRIRSELERKRMDWQAIQVRCQTVQEKLEQSGKPLEEILQTLPSEAEESQWAATLEQVAKRIERLGAINLAAIEEYQSEAERKHYLDSQHNDLTEALDTLENAIRKIDKETRARFKETFDKVNTEFQILFPQLFGGGQAYLELVGEDLLEAGVTVMARPPGKRNSSIHLLSGGEKALTAVAMVFAIFQLNPAPFCLLDEVDAPLDDANVGRFCELVKRLSDTVQIIFVTHNKLAMEMAHHLIGVTMKEPGVSRLVSVDVEEAAALVAS